MFIESISAKRLVALPDRCLYAQRSIDCSQAWGIPSSTKVTCTITRNEIIFIRILNPGRAKSDFFYRNRMGMYFFNTIE
ncbi:hypothetical protein Pan161_46440 [Gimesia algae]|uniref:Uncharacterized protein n=1 Tax=Gimesia algae TaxID=2527971 RepID=A0A517VIZ6_9PLAN|nr:hypothetical protein Pan161_46440 [Gimesia algae]